MHLSRLAIRAALGAAVAALGPGAAPALQQSTPRTPHRLVLQCVPTKEIPTVDDETLGKVTEVVRSRAAAFGAGTEVRRGDAGRVIVELPGSVDPEQAALFLTKPGLLRFIYVKGLRSTRHPTNYRYSAEPVVDDQGRERINLYDARLDGKEVDLREFFQKRKDQYDVVLTGADLIAAEVRADVMPETSQPFVRLKFSEKGAKEFGEFTGSHIGDILCIELDGVLVSAPSVKAAITGGEAVIQGGFMDIAEARQLATLLRSGALPVPLKVVEVTESR
jgi:protein-export membrane protein SecD